MVRESVTIAECVELLNRILGVDPGAITGLIGMKMLCDKALADIPGIELGLSTGAPGGPYDGKPMVGLLGVLNGLFGADGPEGGPYQGHGVVCAVLDGGRIVRFEDARELRMLPSSVVPEMDAVNRMRAWTGDIAELAKTAREAVARGEDPVTAINNAQHGIRIARENEEATAVVAPEASAPAAQASAEVPDA